MDRACFAYEVIAITEGRLTVMHHDFSGKGWQNCCLLCYVILRDFMTVIPLVHIIQCFPLLIFSFKFFVNFVYDFYNKYINI